MIMIACPDKYKTPTLLTRKTQVYSVSKFLQHKRSRTFLIWKENIRYLITSLERIERKIKKKHEKIPIIIPILPFYNKNQFD